MSFFDFNPVHDSLNWLLTSARRRLRWRRIIQGLAIWAGILVVLAVIAIAFMNHGRFSESAIDEGRTLFFSLALVSFIIAVLGNALVRPSRQEMAHYVETRLPALGSQLLTATDAVDGRDIASSPELTEELTRRVVSEHADDVMHLERRPIRLALGALATLGIFALLAITASPLSFKFGAGLLAQPESDERTANPYALQINPGDTSVIEGGDLKVQAVTVGFIANDIQLLVRENADSPWQRTSMSTTVGASGSSTGYDGFLFDLDETRQYAVDADGVRSEVFDITIVERPAVEKLDLTYEYPKRTGRTPDRVEDGGDITAIKGTRVKVEVTPDRAVERGELVVNGDKRIPMTLEDGRLTATLDVGESGQYRVELPAGDTMTPASAEYAITALDDGLPGVRIRAPGRDAKVTLVEEVEFEVDATDDVSINRVELVMSVNGEEEEVIPLDTGSGTTLNARHIEFLENRPLAPGDLISYYARVSDASDDTARVVSTDMYFLDIRPFGQSFRQGNGGGGGSGGGGGGGGQQRNDLSAQQRSLVIALFKLSRDGADLDQSVMTDRVRTLTEAQDRIRDRVEAIVRRVKSRRFVNETPGIRQMTEELPKAAKAMRDVTDELTTGDAGAALPPARKALLHLQRADAAFREVRIAQQRSRGGQGTGSATGDMSNLFRLEMDKFRNQYADLQRGQPDRERKQQLDETMRKLRELSQRQTEELERSIRNVGKGNTNGIGTQSQARLAEQVEELLRELRRLTRKKDDAALEQSMRNLEQAAKDMRESSQSGSRQASRRAADSLREARRAIEKSQRGQAGGSQKDQKTAEQLREIMRRMQATRGAMPGGSQGSQAQRDGNSPGENHGNNQSNAQRSGSANGPVEGGGNGERNAPAGGGRVDGNLDDLRDAIGRQAEALGPVSDQARADNPDAAGDIDAIIASLTTLAGGGETDELSREYDRLLRELQKTERELRGGDGNISVIATRRVEPEENERTDVDEYYRRLSEPARN